MSLLRRHAALLVVLGAGAVLTAVAIRSLQAPAGDVVVLLALAAGGSVAAAAFGAVALRSLRHRSVRTQTVAVVGVALLSASSGVIVAAAGMFISSHDLRAMLAVLALSVAVALGGALQLGTQIDASTRSVRDLARHLAAGGEPSAMARPRSVPELDELADEIADLPARLEELRQRSEALDRSRRELVAWVSHDLRSPLATIRAMAEALDDGMVDDAATVARYHRQIRQDSERLSSLVDDLFELSRINSGTLELRSERVDLHRVVTGAIAGCAVRADAKQVEMRADVPEDLTVVTAGAELARVLQNLLDNAIRHTRVGGVVEVVAADRGGEILLTVTDECGGIPEPDLDRVFDVAFRGDAARARDQQGGGLGLTIAKGLVEACDGDIAVTNAERGCQFTIRFPEHTVG